MKKITIIGGGLAGLTLGISLRQRGIPVTIIEAGHYPRHRVCGEFISGRGIESLERLGLLETLERCGVRRAHTAALFSGEKCSRFRSLPEVALCIPRFALDAGLAKEFSKRGGELCCGARWLETFDNEGTVRASGRRVQKERTGWRWFGLKAHARGIPLEADLEMHFAASGYVGLCRLPGDEINVCGLFRRRGTDPVLPVHLPEVFCECVGALLRSRLSEADWDEGSFCSVGGLPFRQSIPPDPGECRVGDALAMIPPMTGNGMSMAFESAELALVPLCEYADGRRTWKQATRVVWERSRAAFAARLGRAGWLHSAVFRPWIRDWLVPCTDRSDWLWRLFFRATR